MNAVLSHFDLLSEEVAVKFTDFQRVNLLGTIKAETDKLFDFCERNRLPHHPYFSLYDAPKGGTQENLLAHLGRLLKASEDAKQAAKQPLLVRLLHLFRKV